MNKLNIANKYAIDNGYDGVIYKGNIGMSSYYRLCKSNNTKGHIGKPIVMLFSANTMITNIN